ncbi:MAG: hypothetical protein HDS43_01480 [Bacteroides sp.]|nr:hypothetical protein [Bacteroides sp.]
MNKTTALLAILAGGIPVFSAGIDRSYPCVELPDLSGDFILNVTFDNGDEYEGEIR